MERPDFIDEIIVYDAPGALLRVPFETDDLYAAVYKRAGERSWIFDHIECMSLTQEEIDKIRRGNE